MIICSVDPTAPKQTSGVRKSESLINAMKFLVLLIICSNAFAIDTTYKRHKQRLPINMSSSAEDRVSIAAINSVSPTSSTTVFPTNATTESPAKSPSSNTKSPVKGSSSTGGTESPVAEVTYFPTEDIFATRKPTAKPTVSPTATSRPSIEDDGLPTATISPATSSPIKPPSAPFPTYKPTEGTETPTRADNTYSPTEEVVLPTPSPSVSWGPSSIPSQTMSNAPSESSLPSMQPSEYKGEPTNSVGKQGIFVSAIECPSSNSSASMIFDGTTEEFICQTDNSNTRRLVQSGFNISPNLTNPSVVEKLRIYAGHDCIQCDAVEYTLFGSLSSSVLEDGWEIISSGELPWINDEPARNGEGVTINSSYEHGDEALSFTEVTFNNTKAYIHYSLIFRSREEAYDLVLAEVELPGREFEFMQANPPTAKPTKRRTRRPVQVSSKKPTRKPRAPRTKKPQQPANTPRPHRRTRKPSSTFRTKKPTPQPVKEPPARTPKPFGRPAPRPVGNIALVEWDDMLIDLEN